MEVKVIGNCASIISTINYESLKALHTVFVKDENGKVVYGAEAHEGRPSISKMGVSFNCANAAGKAMLNLAIPEEVTCAKTFIVTNYKEDLVALKNFEERINQEIEQENIKTGELLDLIEEV